MSSKKNTKVDFFGMGPERRMRKVRSDRGEDIRDIARLGVGTMLAVGLLGVTAGVAGAAFSN